MKLNGDQTVRFLIHDDGQIAGPYTFEGLESLVYLGKLTAESLVSVEGEDAYLPIRETVLAPLLFPQLQKSVAPAAWAPPGAAASDRTDRKHYGLAEAKFEKVNSADPRGRIEVKAILDDIRQSEIAAGLDLPRRHRFRISKRSRDFWIVVTLGNAAIYAAGIAMQNTTSIVFAIGGSGLFTFGLLWSMYGVMDRY